MQARLQFIFQSRGFQTVFTVAASLLFLCWALVPWPAFPALSLPGGQLPYYFPVISFIPVFWLLFFGKRRMAAAWMLGIMPLFWVFNLNILRPDLYFFWLFLLVWAGADNKQHRITGWLLLSGAMYLWTGVHKINPKFIEGLGFMLKKHQFPGAEEPIIYNGIPAIILLSEVVLALAVIFRKDILRRWLGILLHAGILLFLIFGNWNRAMIPWNAGLLLLHIFTRYSEESFSISRMIKSGLVIPLFLAWVMPLFSYMNLWPQALSWDMYSGRAENYYLHIDEATALNPPDYLREHIFRKEGVYFVGITQWCEAETGGMPSREPALKTRLLIAAEIYIRENPR